jgi:hypothetical protein
VVGITLTLGPRYRGLSRDKCGQKCSCGGHKSSCGAKSFVTRTLAMVLGNCEVLVTICQSGTKDRVLPGGRRRLRSCLLRVRIVKTLSGDHGDESNDAGAHSPEFLSAPAVVSQMDLGHQMLRYCNHYGVFRQSKSTSK